MKRRHFHEELKGAKRVSGELLDEADLAVALERVADPNRETNTQKEVERELLPEEERLVPEPPPFDPHLITGRELREEEERRGAVRELSAEGQAMEKEFHIPHPPPSGGTAKLLDAVVAEASYGAELGEATDEEVFAAFNTINSPSHYTHSSLEAIDAIRHALGDDGFRSFCRGSALKYLWRAEYKGNREEDLAKAAWYCRMAAGDDPREQF